MQHRIYKKHPEFFIFLFFQTDMFRRQYVLKHIRKSVKQIQLDGAGVNLLLVHTGERRFKKRTVLLRLPEKQFLFLPSLFLRTQYDIP